jgi:hypothetical protein
MYVYLQPQGGLNDNMCVISRVLDYCKHYNRTLMIDGRYSEYKMNYADYFDFPFDNVICNSNKFMEICNNPNCTVYPEGLNNKMLDLINGTYLAEHVCGGNYTFNGHMTSLPNHAREETIIVFSTFGGGHGYPLFKQLHINNYIKNECKKRYELLHPPYLCIQVRNTDYTCDYQSFYNEHKTLIHSFNEIYIATDDINVLKFYKTSGLNIKNFTTFPEGSYDSLHNSNLSTNLKILDLMCEIYIIAMSDTLLSNSGGGFINLVRNCVNDKQQIIKQFEPSSMEPIQIPI